MFLKSVVMSVSFYVKIDSKKVFSCSGNRPFGVSLKSAVNLYETHHSYS